MIIVLKETSHCERQGEHGQADFVVFCHYDHRSGDVKCVQPWAQPGQHTGLYAGRYFICTGYTSPSRATGGRPRADGGRTTGFVARHRIYL